MATITHKIDAEGKTLGRVASVAAHALLGKNESDFTKNNVADVLVYITNASKTKMSEKRMLETLHETYSGRPGGLKFKTNAKIISQKGKGFIELYRLAVYNMLPNNKLRPRMMKRLTITD
ncbi:MAG: uL13 family ribosomal protein [Candidatus Pacebacteria bacterium]|nr:uL13 family ribosomal protein [Candidatus Paceibacterota bacterium]MBP9715577.1 uL13 family ribosomal protein [Candidatus Paceibacterota bacterium]